MAIEIISLIFKHSKRSLKTWKYLWFGSVGTIVTSNVPCSFSRWNRKKPGTGIIPRPHPKTSSGIRMSSFSPAILPFSRDTRKSIVSGEARLRTQPWNSMASVRNTFGVIASYGSCEWKSCFHTRWRKSLGYCNEKLPTVINGAMQNWKLLRQLKAMMFYPHLAWLT